MQGRANLKAIVAGITVIAAVALAATIGAGWTIGRARANIAVPRAAPALFGVLQPEQAFTAAAHAAGVRAVVVEAHWDRAQPSRGALSKAYVKSVSDDARRYQSAGMSVVFSPGLQYPPKWVFALPGGSRFVDQRGTVWRGPDGADVADAVWNQSVRNAQGGYLAALGQALGGLSFAAVRAGGLVDGELRYPDATLQNSFWGYDRAAQSASPVPGWRPGQRGPAAAGQFVQWYLSSLVGYERFIVQTEQRSFPRTRIEVLFPAGGLRPGQTDAAIAGDLRGRSAAERNGSLQEGLDWAAQVSALPPGTIVYSTNVAGRGVGAGPELESPIDYLAGLAARAGLEVGGENAGGDGPEALALSVQRARALHLIQLFWFSEADFFSGRPDRPALADVRKAALALAGGRSS